MAYNYQNMHVCVVTTTPATDFADGSIVKANCLWLGVNKSESGFKLTPEEKEKATTGEDLVLSWKLEIETNVLSSLTDANKAAIDGIVCSLIFLPVAGVTIPANAVPFTTNLGSVGVVLPGSPTGLMTAPCTLFIQEDEKYGSGKVSPYKITGELVAATKAELRKTVTITA